MYFKTYKENAFTLAEILIVIAVIGVLSVFVLSSLSNATPDKNKVMFKKAYSITERTVQELINDETLYPYNQDLWGFMNAIQVQIPGEAIGQRTVANSGDKFAVLFKDKLNVVESSPKTNHNYVFTTTDGITWTIPDGAFTRSSNANNAKVITVDVNGNSKGANCYASDNLQDHDCDQFRILVYFDGKVNVTGTVEREFLTSDSLKRE